MYHYSTAKALQEERYRRPSPGSRRARPEEGDVPSRRHRTEGISQEVACTLAAALAFARRGGRKAIWIDPHPDPRAPVIASRKGSS